MMLRTLAVAAAMAAYPLLSQAAPITGQLDITGNVNVAGSDFSDMGNVDFTDGFGTANIATGGFADVTTVSEAAGGGTSFTVFELFDIDFTTPGKIYEGGGFSFIADSFFDFDNETAIDEVVGFMANGLILASGFDDTPGVFSFSTQGGVAVASFSSTTTVIPLPASVLMLMGALGGLAFLGKRRPA